MSHPFSSDGRPSNGGAFANSSRTADPRALSREVIDHLRESVDVREVLRRIVTVTRAELKSDRAWVLRPVAASPEFAKVAYSDAAPGTDGGEAAGDGPIPLAGSRGLLARVQGSRDPVVVREGDPDLDTTLAQRFGIRSLLVQSVHLVGGEMWALGAHSHDAGRRWTVAEAALLGELGRHAAAALDVALANARAARELAKVQAILDHLPDGAALYDADGRLDRLNAAARRAPATLFSEDPDARVRLDSHRNLDGTRVSAGDIPAMRALRGETVKADYLVTDPKTGDDRVYSVSASPVRDERSRVVGSIVLARDITDERANAERETWRRRHAECLAELGLETSSANLDVDDYDVPAARVARAVVGTVRIYLYRDGHLDMVGFGSETHHDPELRRYFAENPYRPGEGLPGTVFQIGRPLLFYDVRGGSVLDFARDEAERRMKAALEEQSLIACPIESYGERVGAILVSQSDPRRNFDAEDLEFVESVADRLGAAVHIHRLTRVAHEGHRAAEELARQEVDARLRLEAVLETAPIGIAVVSADELRFELANARFLDYVAATGRTIPDGKMVGLPVGEVLPDCVRPLQAVAETGETRIDEACETGPERTVNRIISAVRGRFSGTIQTLTMLVQDVTDQIRAQREIEDLAALMAERSAQLDSIISSMTDAVWVYSAEGTVVEVNQAALDMFGLASRSEAVENGSFEQFDLRYPDGRRVPREEMPYARALAGEPVPDSVVVGRHRISGKDVDLSIAAAPIESNGIVGAVLVVRDITALQELDRKKDEFLSVASHELRTPLTTIKGYTQLIAQTVNDLSAADRATYIHAVLGEIERMMGLISELLDVSRIETNRLQIHRQRVGWSEFVESRVAAFRVQHPARSFRIDAKVGDLTVVADLDRMRQVIDNLISNGIRYSPEGSAIDVCTWIDGDAVVTCVADHGIGVPKDEMPYLFDRFHRARNVSSRYYGGLGLGLYISRAIVDAHGGTIGVESEEGQGSKFTFRLPLGRE